MEHAHRVHKCTKNNSSQICFSLTCCGCKNQNEGKLGYKLFFNFSTHIKKELFCLLHVAQNAKGVFIFSAVFSPAIVLIRQNVSIAGIAINLSCDGHREDTKQPRS